MHLPIHDVTLPSVLHGQSNGHLPDSILKTIPCPGGGTARFVRPADLAFRAMFTDAALAGHRLLITSPADSYRSYTEQEALFRRRYQTSPVPGVASVRWNGASWWLRPGLATAAIPGESNHGLGLAGDLGEQRDSDAAPESLSDAAVAWLIANAARYGISAELQSEPWHWRYYAGDDTPASVHTGPSTEETPMRFLFGKDIPGVPELLVDRVHVSDGVRYHVHGQIASVDKLLDRAGASPVVRVTKADLPAGWDYTRFVVQLCGQLDPGELDDEHGDGPIDLAAVTQAARDGARQGLDGATLTVNTP